MGERVSSVTLGKALQTNAANAPVRSTRICNNCGTVDAVNLVEVKGEGSYLGTIGGGVVGALLGSQVGGGSGRTVAEIAGALGGAYAGRAIEGKSRTSNHYEVVVRLQNGATQTVTFAADPGYRVGDKVRINDGVIVRNPCQGVADVVNAGVSHHGLRGLMERSAMRFSLYREQYVTCRGAGILVKETWPGLDYGRRRR